MRSTVVGGRRVVVVAGERRTRGNRWACSARNELRKPESYFDKIPPVKADANAVKLAVNLIEQQSGRFEPNKMPNEYARAIHELVQAKVEQRAPQVAIAPESGEAPKVVNIMDALKVSMQARGPDPGPRCCPPPDGQRARI